MILDTVLLLIAFAALSIFTYFLFSIFVQSLKESDYIAGSLSLLGLIGMGFALLSIAGI